MIRSFRTVTVLVALTVGGSLSVTACAPGSSDEAAEKRVGALSGAGALIAVGTLDGTTDLAGLSDVLENGLPQNVLGGVGSGLAWAGGDTFLAVPDRGPNATPYTNGNLNDNTTSFISRFETVNLPLTAATSGPLPFVLTPTLQATTLLYSGDPLVYGSTPNLPSAVPVANGAGRFYFTGRSDNFGAGVSTNPDFGRLDPEAIRVSPDGNSVFVADEYGPYVYQFDRATGKRIRSFALPARFAINHLGAVGSVEISSNSSGRVTNKGMEGLAITPDGTLLVGLMQSPLLQDGGDGGRANRIVTIEIVSGITHEYVYDNVINKKAFNSSEIIALNSHQFLIDTRDGKGLGDGSVAVVKQLWAVDIAHAEDVSGLATESLLLAKAAPKKLFLDIVSVLTANGIATKDIPAKLEGLAFGRDITVNGVVTHTLYVANDNDFVPAIAGPNRWYVFGVTDADVASLDLSYAPQQVTDRGPDLAVAKTASATTVVTGASLDYTLTVANTGLVPSGAVLVSDLLPAGLTVTACMSAGSCGSSPTGPTVAFPSISGVASQTATLATKVSCALADGTVIVNRATVTSSGPDGNPANNEGSVAITAVNPAPMIDHVTVDVPVLWPPNGKMNAVNVSYDVADNCPDTNCALTVSSNEGNNQDWQVVDSHTVQLRATRNGNGPGRTYSIPVTCKDSGGATSVATATVVVPHDQ